MAPRKKQKPTIEDRLEATVQTLELVASMLLQIETKLNQLATFAAQTDKKLDRFAAFTLATVVSHHKRIKKLEGR